MEFKNELGDLAEFFYIYNVETEEEVKQKIVAEIERSHKLIKELKVEKMEDIFNLPEKYDRLTIINDICEGLALENYYIKGINHSMASAEKEAKENNHHCLNDELDLDNDDDIEKFGIARCNLHCPYRVSDEDGFVCLKHYRWLPPADIDGRWISGLLSSF